MIITIDGPTASGKSTIARMIAQRNNLYYLPTGWLYRAVSYLLVAKKGYSNKALAAPKKEDIAYCLDPKHLDYQYDVHTGKAQLLFKQEDITPYLKDYTVDISVAIISPVILVRDLVGQTQRYFAHKYKRAIIEGRDTGSVVFKDADYKLYLTASLEVRALRWQKDQAKRGNEFSLEQAKNYINDRDIKDKERSYCPLVIPEDAHVIDTSDLTLDQTIEKIEAIISEDK